MTKVNKPKKRKIQSLKKNKKFQKDLTKLLKPEEMKTFVVDDEETVVEKVLNERNLITTPNMEHTAPVHHETQLGTVRIEGEVTPQKLALAKQFEQVFQASVDEIMGLASMTPNPETMDFVKNSNLSTKQVEEMKAAKPWTTFQINGETLLKTTDNKLENVKFYFYRLERAVINQINLKKQAEEKLEQVKKQLEDTQITLDSFVKNSFKEQNLAEKNNSFFLPISKFFSNLCQTVLNLLK